uniref:Putative secreted protein n=1 Tax=Anopheles triannulatus TaxID=58253 RepID=A0A2M4B3B7_9DIPT
MARNRFSRLVVERMSTLSLSLSGSMAMIHQAHAGPSATSSQRSSRSGILPKLLKISHRIVSGRLWCQPIAFSSTFSCSSRTDWSRSSASPSSVTTASFSSSKNSTFAVSYPSFSCRATTRNRRPPTVDRMEQPSPSCTQSRMSSIVPYSTYRWRLLAVGSAIPNCRSPLSIARRTISR